MTDSELETRRELRRFRMESDVRWWAHRQRYDSWYQRHGVRVRVGAMIAVVFLVGVGFLVWG